MVKTIPIYKKNNIINSLCNWFIFPLHTTKQTMGNCEQLFHNKENKSSTLVKAIFNKCLMYFLLMF